MNFESIQQFALALDGVTQEPHHHFSSFRVDGKIFVTVPPGDEFIHIFVNEVQREMALSLYPEFIEKLFWGSKVLGLRVCLAHAESSIVKALVADAYNLRLNSKPKATARTSKGIKANQIDIN
jgi:hypothetical protein